MLLELNRREMCFSILIYAREEPQRRLGECFQHGIILKVDCNAI